MIFAYFLHQFTGTCGGEGPSAGRAFSGDAPQFCYINDNFALIIKQPLRWLSVYKAVSEKHTEIGIAG